MTNPDDFLDRPAVWTKRIGAPIPCRGCADAIEVGDRFVIARDLDGHMVTCHEQCYLKEQPK